MEDLEGAYKDALNAEGSALKENAAYLDSIQGRIDLFNNSLQTMWMNFINAEVVKDFVNFGTTVIQLIDKVGVLETALAGLFTYLNLSSKYKFDWMSMLGLYDLENQKFSFGKHGLTGWVANLVKSRKQNNITQAVLGDPSDIRVSVEEFADAIRDNINDYVTIDTSQIDSEIDSVQNKLTIARQQLEDAKSKNWTYYKMFKSTNPGPDRDSRVAEKTQEVETLEAKLVSLQAKRDEIVSSAVNNVATSMTTSINDQTQAYQSMLTVLSQVKGVQLSIGNEQDAAVKIDAISQAANNGQQALANYVATLDDSDIALKAYVASVDDGNYSLAGFQKFIQQHNANLKKSGIAAKAAAIGHQILNTALSMGISLLVSSFISVIMDLVNAEERAAEAARNAASASEKLREQDKSLEDYKNQIRELRKELDSNTLSESDAYDAREKLLTIQNDLIEKFGLEKDGINLVTGAIEDQIAAIDELSKKNAQQWLNTNQKEINKAIEFFDSDSKGSKLDPWYEAVSTGITNWAPTQNVRDMIDEYAKEHSHMSTLNPVLTGAQEIYFNGSVDEVKAEVEDFQNWLSTKEEAIQTKLTSLTSAPEQTDDVKNQIESLKSDLAQLQDVREDIGAEYKNWFGDDSTYAANKKVLEQTQYNTALTKYTDQYTKILQAQNDLIDAQASGNKEGIKSALDTINAETAAAATTAETNGQTYMVNFFNGIQDEYDKMSNEFKLEEDLLGNALFKDTGKSVKDTISGALSELQGMNAKEILQIGEIEPDNAAFVTLTSVAESYGMTIEDLCNSLVKLKYIQSGFSADVAADVIPVQTYSELSASIENYNEILSQTSEIVSDNTEVTQEYKDSLTAIGISSEELAECFDENNGLIVTNADRLKDLIKKQKDEYKNNVKTAKSQAKLKYYKLAKDLVNTVKSTKNLTNAQRDHIKTILEEMDAVQDTISKYNMLEAELLGVTNAYKKLADAQEIDEATDYGSKAEEMVNALANAFNTGELGTAAAQAAFEGLIPDWVVANAQSVDEAMESAYQYMKSGALSGLFDIKYDDDGKLESVQMTLDKVKAFTSALTEADTVFHGTWDEFTLDPAIKNLDDFANAIGVTKEVAFAYLTELERYDASNIFGNSGTGLLEQLMGDNFDYAIQQASQKYAQAAAAMAKEFDQVNEKVDLFNRKILRDGDGNMVTLASETFTASDFGLDGNFAFNVTPILPDGTKLENVKDYIAKHLASGGKLEDMDIFLGSYATLDEAVAKAERLSELQGLYYENQLAIEEMENKALDFASAWAKTSDQLTDAREEAESLGRELAGAKDGVNESTGRTVEEIEADIKKNDQLISDLLSNLSKLKDEFGGEPTELVVGVALDEIQEDIDNFKKDLEKKPAELKAAITEIDSTGFENLGLTKNADGSWSGLAELDWYQKLDPASQAEVTNYLNMVESEHYLNLLMGDGVPTIEEHLARIVEILETVYSLQVNAKIDTTEVMSFRDWLALNPLVTTVKAYLQKAGNWLFGSNVNGTANVGGNAYAGGKWGAKQTEQSLVGELGPEMIVRGNRWFTVGENGAEFTQVKKGDIIFNHRQTEELLKNGHVTSRGKAYASGTAYASIDTFTPYVPPVVSSGGNSDSDNDDTKDDAEQVVDFIEMKLEEIEAIIEKTSNRIANFLDDTTSIKSKDELYDELIKAEKDKSEAYLAAAQKYNVQAAAALSGVPQQYQEMARNGAISIEEFLGEDQVEIAEKIQEYRDWVAKADEAENGHLETIAAISAHRVEQLEDIATDFENIISIAKSHSDLLQTEMDFIEESGGRLSEDYYEELKKHSQRQLDDMQAERVALQKILDDSVAAGDVVVGSDDWYSMLETIYEVDKEIIDCKTSLEEFQNAINDLYWDNFDKLIAEIDAIDSELSNLFDLISDTDKIVDDMGNWTADGYTALGLLVQQMEVAQQKSEEYGDAISKLKKDYKNGLYSTDEYNEKLAELTDGQYDAIKSYEDAKDAIVDLNKTRIDVIKDGIQKEIDAYEELISKKKESLDADKDARDFERSVEESNKSISDVERKLASLKGNTSSSAIAERRRLEEELRKLQQEREDLFYDESVENQQEALDKELENFRDAKNKEIEDLEEYLKNQEKVLQDSFAIVQENTQQIAGKLVEIAEDYGVTISDTVATPWIKGANAIGTYEEQLNTSVSATTKNLEALKQQLKDLETQADKTANSVINATHSSVVETNDGHQTSIKGYANGSKSVEYDQWALIDELGDELQLVPNKAGRLDYIKKGTGILNNTLTEKLIDLAIDPTSMLENSRPVVGAPGITTTNNTFTIDASVGTLLHVEHLDGNNPAEVAKLVDKAWEKKMQTLNSSIKKFAR